MGEDEKKNRSKCTIYIDDPLLTKLKIYCVKNKTSMSKLIRELVDAHLNK